MRRREFIAGIGSAATTPLAAMAQQSALPVIGVLDGRSAEHSAHLVAAFRRGLNETGYAEGRNVALEYRWAHGQYDRLPALAADLVGRRVAVIATSGNASTLAAKTATETIPIVFNTGADPVQAGLIASLNRPGGNITGVTSLGVELGPKRLELMNELVPAAAAIALLVNPANRTSEIHIRNAHAAAGKWGRKLQVLQASTEREIDLTFATLAQQRPGGLVIAPESFFNSRSEQLAAMTVRHAVPAIYSYREFVAAGGLMSYGGSITESYRQVGIFVGRILKGEKPAGLPVQQSVKAELFVNLKTAKALGVTVPLALLGRADEVIE
jgi:putative ABC transport system substrate-binding protein